MKKLENGIIIEKGIQEECVDCINIAIGRLLFSIT